MRFRKIRSKSYWIQGKSPRNLGFFPGFWKILAEFWKILTGNWKFWPESGNFWSVRIFRVLGEENRNRPIGIGFWWWRSAADPLEQSGRPDSGRFRSVFRVDRVTEWIWTALNWIGAQDSISLPILVSSGHTIIEKILATQSAEREGSSCEYVY